MYERFEATNGLRHSARPVVLFSMLHGILIYGVNQAGTLPVCSAECSSEYYSGEYPSRLGAELPC